MLTPEELDAARGANPRILLRYAPLDPRDGPPVQDATILAWGSIDDGL